MLERIVTTNLSRLRRKVNVAIRKFNKYRSPEAKAKLLRLDDKEIVVDFTGTFCQTCGFYDYFDDFRIFLEEIGIKTKIIEINKKIDGATVIFCPKNVVITK